VKRPYAKNEIIGRKLFEEYVKWSAYPVLIFGDFDEITSREILQNYYETVILRDVVERYSIRDVSMLKAVSKLLLNSISSEFTYTKLHKNLKSMGFSPSKSTVIDYVSYMEEAYLFFTVKRFYGSEKKRQTSPQKLYVVDTGFLSALTFTGSEERGKRLENIAFIELVRRKKDVFYYQNGKECDFIVMDRGKAVEAIQVTESLKTSSKREIEGLKKAMEESGAEKGIILTDDERDSIGDIEVVPMWEWMIRR
jgi:predicted AAA+ superfamily ATPase